MGYSPQTWKGQRTSWLCVASPELKEEFRRVPQAISNAGQKLRGAVFVCRRGNGLAGSSLRATPVTVTRAESHNGTRACPGKEALPLT